MTAESRNAGNISIYVCAHEDCNATFTKGTRLDWHMRLHTDERPFECTFTGCSKKYTRQFHLTRHVKVAHAPKAAVKAESPDDLKCPYDECGKQFSSKHTLYKHVNISHKKRQFKCEHCPKTFIKHQHLKIHTYEHTKVLPYPCTEPGCDKAFLLPSRLKVHQRTHEGYKCAVAGCMQVFSKWSLLRKHRKVDHQKSFPCPLCDRVFYSKSSMESHSETHKTKREAFCCPHEGCGRFYLHERNLHDHMRKAHENKRFACDVPGCSRTFFARQTLRRHKATHDPNRPLPPKKRNKKTVKRRKINIPTKSAAAILSGHAASPTEENKLLGRKTLEDSESEPHLDSEPESEKEIEPETGEVPDIRVESADLGSDLHPYLEPDTEVQPRPELKGEDLGAMAELHPKSKSEAGLLSHEEAKSHLQLESPNRIIVIENEQAVIADVIPQCSDIGDGCKVMLNMTISTALTMQ